MNAAGYYQELEDEKTAPERITIPPEVLARIARSAKPAPVTPPASEQILDAVAVDVTPPAPAQLPTPTPEPEQVGKFYEMGKDGGLVEVKSTFNDLTPGTIIQWGGNAAWAPTYYCILSRIPSKYGVQYDCYNLDKPENNSHPHRVEARSIKSYDDPSLWHSQHYYIEDERKTPEEVETLRKDLEQRRQARKEQEDAATREADRLEAEGRKLWPRLIGECPAIVQAEFEHDESDVYTDYFGSRTVKVVILAPSKHKRDLFPELRMAAEKYEETRHLGVGKGRFNPRVEISENFISHGCCYYAGARSHWHRELDQNEDGSDPIFQTEEAAREYIAAKGDPEPISFDGTVVNFAWGIREEEIEHREKYTGGHGYYLGHRYESGWHVCKKVLYKDGPSRADYINLAKCHDHLKPSK